MRKCKWTCSLEHAVIPMGSHFPLHQLFSVLRNPHPEREGQNFALWGEACWRRLFFALCGELSGGGYSSSFGEKLSGGRRSVWKSVFDGGLQWVSPMLLSPSPRLSSKLDSTHPKTLQLFTKDHQQDRGYKTRAIRYNPPHIFSGPDCSKIAPSFSAH